MDADENWKISSSLSPILERHSPQHPLPKEIQSMTRDETVCQFCGVSYLIHHEMKKLEEKVDLLEKELATCRGSVQREAKLKEELKKAKNALVVAQDFSKEKEEIINKLTIEIQNLKTKNEKIEKQNNNLIRNNQEIRMKYKSYKEQSMSNLQHLQNHNTYLKLTIGEIKTETNNSLNEFKQYSHLVQDNLNVVIQACSSDIKTLRSKCIELQAKLDAENEEKNKLENQISSLQNALNTSKESSSNTTQELLGKNKELISKLNGLDEQYKVKDKDYLTSQAQVRSLNSEILQMKEIVNLKQNEMQNAIQKLNKSEHNADLTVKRMSEEIRHLERDLISANEERDKLKRREEERLERQKELNMKINERSGEMEHLRESLEVKKSECVALRNEREQMVLSHQHQISQLRDSFREKLDAAQGSPEMFKKEIKKLKERHEEELQLQESRLKENFAIEFGLQKDKSDECIAACEAKYKDIIEEAKARQHQEMQRHMNEASVARQQLDSFRHEVAIERQEHKDECDSLKRMVSQLEEKVTELMNNQAETDFSGQADLAEAKQKLEAAEKDIQKLEKHISELKEEITILQETVRRECEERFELTEALSETREQLQAFKTSSTSIGRSMSTPRLPVSFVNTVNGDGGNLSNKTLQSLGENLRSSINGGESVSPVSSPIRNPPPVRMQEIPFGGGKSPKKQNGYLPKQSNTDVTMESARKRIAAAIKKR